MQGYRRIYFDKATGNVILVVAYNGDFIPSTIEQDISTFSSLTIRNRDTFDVIELSYGMFQRDFIESVRYRVNTETKELIFEYPNPENPDEPIIPDKPLSVEIEEVKQENQLLQQSLLELTSYAAMQDERLATQEQALLELSTVLAGGDE